MGIKKKLVRKTLDMIKKISDDKYEEFWKEYSTNIKLGVIEDTANRTRLAKLLRFTSSNGKLTSLAEYVERMKDKQESIFYMAGSSKEEVEKSPFVERLTDSPCALITSKFGWTGNMQKIIQSQTHSKTQDMQRDYYLNQKKTLEINPRHPLIKELLRRVEDNPADKTASDMAVMMYNTATLRSGYSLKDTVNFAQQIEAMMRQTLGVDADEQVEEEEEITDEEPPEEDEDDEEEEEEEDEEEEEVEEDAPKDEL